MVINYKIKIFCPIKAGFFNKIPENFKKLINFKNLIVSPITKEKIFSKPQDVVFFLFLFMFTF